MQVWKPFAEKSSTQFRSPAPSHYFKSFSFFFYFYLILSCLVLFGGGLSACFCGVGGYYCHVCLWMTCVPIPWRDHKKTSDPLELDLKTDKIQKGICSSLNVTDPHVLRESDTFRRCGFPGVGMVLLEEVYRYGNALRSPISSHHQLLLPVGKRSNHSAAFPPPCAPASHQVTPWW